MFLAVSPSSKYLPIYFIIKMNVVIKIGNIQHLHVLEELLFSKIMVRDDKIAVVKLPFYNFIDQLVTILTDYTRSTNDTTLNLFMLSYFLRKYQSPFEIYRHMYGFISMWKKYLEVHEESRIMLSLLSNERSGKESVKLFLKIRKAILRNLNIKIMQEIMLNHQDIIAISHSIFSSEMKTYAAKKIHELFTSLKKRTLYSNNKMNGAVVCEFFMNCSEKFEKQEIENIKTYFQNAPIESKEALKYQRTFKPLEKDLFQDGQPNYYDYMVQEAEFSPIVTKKDDLSKKKLRPNNFIINNMRQDDRYDSPKKSIDRLENAKDIVNKKYSNSWQKFLKTNQEMKQKLLKNHQQNV